MKCTFCGGEVASDQLKCPFCGKENEIAYKRSEEIAKEYEKTRLERENVLKKAKPRLIDRILNRTIIGLICLTVLIFAFSILATVMMQEGLFGKRIPKDYKETLEKYYEEGRYEDIYLYVEEYDIFDPDNQDTYDYSQLALQYYYVLQHRKCFYAVAEYLMGESDKLSEYDLEYTFKNGYRLLVPDIGVYEEISDRNAAVFDIFKEEVKLDWMIWLKLTEEEIDDLTREGEKYYMTDGKLDALREKAVERLGISYEK